MPLQLPHLTAYLSRVALNVCRVSRNACNQQQPNPVMALVLTRGIVRALSVFDFDFEPVQLRFACSCSCLEYVLGMCCDTCEPVPYQQLTYAV